MWFLPRRISCAARVCYAVMHAVPFTGTAKARIVRAHRDPWRCGHRAVRGWRGWHAALDSHNGPDLRIRVSLIASSRTSPKALVLAQMYYTKRFFFLSLFALAFDLTGSAQQGRVALFILVL